jgi:hypothetical protein
MATLCDALQLASAVALGLFAGAMLTEGCVLVPWWRSLDPAEFFAWYAANDRRLVRFFGPLTAAAALLALSAAAASIAVGDVGRGAATLAAGLMVVAVVMFPLHFQRVNARFATASIRPDELPGALRRWEKWHWLRTALAIGAFGWALMAVVDAA